LAVLEEGFAVLLFLLDLEGGMEGGREGGREEYKERSKGRNGGGR